MPLVYKCILGKTKRKFKRTSNRFTVNTVGLEARFFFALERNSGASSFSCLSVSVCLSSGHFAFNTCIPWNVAILVLIECSFALL